MTPNTLRALKSRLREVHTRGLRLVEPARRRYLGTLDAAGLRQALQEVGVVPGETVMVHVSMNEIRRAAPAVDAISLIKLLQELIGEEGTLLVPTFPFSGYELDYVTTTDTFDVRRTPSQMGLMTEVFRRMPGVVRSLHPTHPVAGWGSRADEFLSQHHEGSTFGENSPFGKLAAAGGLVVGIGVGLFNGFTIIHSAEYLHDDVRVFAFSPDTRTMTVIDGERTFAYELRPLRPGLDRDLRGIQRSLLRDDTLRYTRRAGMLLATARADRFFDRSVELIANGTFYRSRGSARGGSNGR